MPRFATLVAASMLLLVLLAGGCTKSSGSGSSSSASSNVTLRFSGIPDADKDKLTQQYEAVTAYLRNELGVNVEYVHVPDYTGAVTALAANKVDVVWLGGVTSVQAEERTNGETTFLACRESDRHFKSYFIAGRDLGIGALGALTDLPDPGDRTFTFGSKSSTSGHVMPRHFLVEAGMVPEETFRSVSYQLQGGHTATLRAVQSGQVHLGALNYHTYDGAAESDKDATEIIFTTPEYVDYCIVGHERLGDLNERVAAAFAKLDASNPAHAPVLEAFSAERFVRADPQWWDGIRAVLADLDLD